MNTTKECIISKIKMFKIKFICLTIAQIRLSIFFYFPNAFLKFCRVFFSDSKFIDTIEFNKAAFAIGIIFLLHIFIVSNIIKKFYKIIDNLKYEKTNIYEMLCFNKKIFIFTLLQILLCSIILNSIAFFLFKNYYAFWCVCVFMEILIIIYVSLALKEYY